MMSVCHQQEREGGFALAEALIAVAIIAAMLGVTYQVILTTSRARVGLQDERRAALFAQSMMARVGTDIALTPGMIEGGTDGLNWRVEIDRYRPQEQGGGDSSALLHVAVSVANASRGRPGITLQSLRYAP